MEKYFPASMLQKLWEKVKSYVDGYLPLTAGADKPLTGDLVFKPDASSDAYSMIYLGNYGFSLTSFDDNYNQVYMQLSPPTDSNDVGHMYVGCAAGGNESSIRINGVADPLQDGEAATKGYVDRKTAAGLFTLQLEQETGDLYAVYPDGTIPPNFEYDSATGNLYYVTDD